MTVQPREQPPSAASDASLPPLSQTEAAARRGRTGRLSMSATHPGVPAQCSSRLSLPSGMQWAADASVPRPKLATSLAAPATMAVEQLTEEPWEDGQQEQQAPAEQQQQQPPEESAAQHEVAAAIEQPAEVESPAFTIRSHLAAEDEGVSAELPQAVSPQAHAGSGAAARSEPPAAVDEQEQVVADAPAVQQGDEEALAAAAFAPRPRLSMSPALSAGAAPHLSSFGSAAGVDAAAAFAAKPRLAMSPAISSGSVWGAPEAAPLPAVGAAAEPHVQQQMEGSGEVASQEEQPTQTPMWRHESPAMSDNPLAAGAAASPAVTSRRRLSHSPAPRCVLRCPVLQEAAAVPACWS